MDAGRFPPIAAEALDGTPFITPRDLTGVRTVALVGFAIDQRAEVETWVPFLDALVRSRPDVRARLLAPVNVPALLRPPMIKAMKAAVTAPELRASTIPVFTKVEPFAQALGVVDRSHLTVLVVLQDARITWRGSGPYSEAAGASLTEALR